ncbi:MAG: GNAT family N-acetyltransferase [Actinobacteria bacterium]|nr:GNAT family N-acetyltransferase [Actinomycetota bacterium]
MVLESDRLVLRRFCAADLDELVALDSDPEVMFFITGGRATPREQVEREVLPAFIAGGYWAAVEKVGGRFIGWFHLRPPDDPELGYRLRRDVWGRGYATEGSRALIDHAFTHGAARVRAETMVAHLASRRVMEKAGMREVRRFHADWPDRIPGDELGDVEYAITRQEWLAHVE